MRRSLLLTWLTERGEFPGPRSRRLVTTREGRPGAFSEGSRGVKLAKTGQFPGQSQRQVRNMVRIYLIWALLVVE